MRVENTNFLTYIANKIMVRNTLLVIALIAAGLLSHAQVQVSEEPRHHKVFENAWIRILDVHIPPHDTSLMHKHSTPSVFMILSNTKTGSEAIVEPEKPTFNDGHVWFEGFYKTPRIHRVWNSDTVEFHVIDMELLNKKPGKIAAPMRLPAVRMKFDEKPVRCYALTVPANTKIRLPERDAPILLVTLSSTAGTITDGEKIYEKKGDYKFFAPGAMIRLSNSGAAEQFFALFELK